jgi:hypothetical protein
MKKMMLGAAALLLLCMSQLTGCKIEPTGVTPKLGMVHPGVLHTQEDFAAMKTLINRWNGGITPESPAADPESPLVTLGVTLADNDDKRVTPAMMAEYRESRSANRKMYAEYRAYSNWQALMNDSDGNYTYSMQGGYYDYIGRDGEVAGTKTPVETDIRAAYKNALRWMLTGDRRHAQKSFQILDTYAQNLKGFKDGGFGDHMLMVGLQGFLYAAAAELIRRGHNVIDGEDSGYIENQFENIDRSIREVWVYYMEDQYFAFPAWRAGNQGAMILSAYIACAIYLDDQMMYKKAFDALVWGENDGGLKRYIHHTSGQCGETTRDQPHAMLAVAKIALACETAYKQGDNPFEAYDDALWKASEFGARYNLGDNNFNAAIPAPFDPYSPTYYVEWQWDLSLWGATGISSDGRSGDSIFPAEIAYNHYVRREGIQMPWTESMLPRNGEGWNASDSAPGYSSFLIAAPELVRELGLNPEAP